MTKILFVCHGNICRSPMAEFLLRQMAEREGIALSVASAATSTEEIGNAVYPPVQRLLQREGIDCRGKMARQLTRRDYDDFDLILCMDKANVRNATRMLGGDPEGKIRLLLDYAGRAGQEVADPWYTRDFEAAARDIRAGCEGLLRQLSGGG